MKETLCIFEQLLHFWGRKFCCIWQAESNAIGVAVVLLMPRPDTLFAFVAAASTLRIYFNAQTKWQEKFTSRVQSGPQPQSNKAGTAFSAVPKIQLLLWLIIPHKLATGCQRFVAARFPSYFMLYPTLGE